MLFCFSVNHHNAPLAVREQLTITPGQWERYTTTLPPHIEAVHLTTCNRIELYLDAPTHEEATAEWLRLMEASQSEVTAAYAAEDAGRHLFRVAAGLDSAVLGEPEILGQVTRAYEAALTANTAGPRLALLFRAAIHAAKQVRTETPLSEGSVSAMALALRHIEAQTHTPLTELDIVVVGAGQMGRAVLSALASRGAQNVTLLSRTLERAQAVADEFGFSARPFTTLEEALTRADAAFTATAAPAAIITHALIDGIVGRRSAALHLVDLAVPRDVDPAAAAVAGVSLVNLEDLEQGIAKTHAERQNAARQGEALITEALTAFMADYHARAVAPTITEMRQWADDIRQAELKRIVNRLPTDHGDYDAYLEEFSHRLMNKLLHHPTVSLRQHAADPQFESVIRSLFGLDTHD